MEGFRFGPVLTDKVIDVVKRVGDMPYRYGNASIPVRFEDDGGGGGGGGGGIRLGQIESTWLKGFDTEVTLLDGIGTPVTPLETFDAKNLLVTITVDCGTKKVVCAKIGAYWHLIAAEC